MIHDRHGSVYIVEYEVMFSVPLMCPNCSNTLDGFNIGVIRCMACRKPLIVDPERDVIVVLKEIDEEV